MTTLPIAHSRLYSSVLQNLKLEFFSAGDAHGEERKFRMYVRDVLAEPRCQLVVATGDYLAQPEFDHAKALTEIEPLVGILKETEKPVLLLGGNYDPLGVSAKLAEQFGEPTISIGCTPEKHESVLPGNTRNYFGYDFVGCEGTNPINGRFPGERSEEELEAAVSLAIKKIPRYDQFRTVFLTHAPPFQCGGRDELGKFGLPQPYWGKHVGSTTFRENLYRHKPLLMVSGHIHEGVGATIYQWKDHQDPTIHDVRMHGTPHRILVIMRKNGRTRQSVVVNHGTVEYWEYFRFRIAEKGDIVMMEVCKRRLSGKDPITKFLDKVSGRGDQALYDHVFDPDNLLSTEVLGEIETSP